MIQASGVIICLGYIFGLLLTAVPWGGVWMLVISVIGAILFKQRRLLKQKNSLAKTNKDTPGRSPTKSNENLSSPLPTPSAKVWLVAGLVGLLASVYFQFRVPHPGANDISNFVPSDNSDNQEQLFIVRGTLTSSPRMTRSQRGQFWLEATQLNEVKNDVGPAAVSKGVTGKLYVTVPLLQSTGLYPGQQVALTGILYKPKPALNPSAFDFQQFLKQQGAFAGFSGRWVNVVDEDRKWGLWRIRERIVRSQVRGLGVPEGPLVSAMTLGSKVVDVPYDIRDLFVKVGLAHALAAPGLKTSIILGTVLALTKRSTRFTQVTLGTIALIIFLTLTGFQPGALRAVIMGFTALIGVGLKRKVKKIGALLVTAVLLLLLNPLWIWDLGFELSFLATLGLVVTFVPLMQRLEWLPPTIAALIAVPLAAIIWTLPLLLHVFSIIPVYSLPVNILTTPLVSIIIIGGMISGLVGLILPDIGSALASFLYHPTHILIQLEQFVAQLPGNSVAVGSISTATVIVIYTLIIFTWLVPWWQKRWLFASLMAVGLVFIPIWHANTVFQITVLASGAEPVLVIQDKGKVTLVNSGNESTGRYTILPFLQQQGVNQIDWAIAKDFQSNSSNGWFELLQHLPIKTFYDYSPTSDNTLVSLEIQKEVQKQKGTYQPLSVGQTVSTGTTVAQLINDQLPIMQMQILGQSWLLIGNLKSNELLQIMKSSGLQRPQVLWCLGESLKEFVPLLQPQVAIASSTTLDPKTLSELSQSQTKLFITGKDGAVQWTPQRQFEAFIQGTENKSSNL